MPSRFGSWIRLALILALGGALAAGAAPPTEASRFVRIESSAAQAASALELAPRFAADYGSFRWLELSAAEASRRSPAPTPGATPSSSAASR